MHKITKGLKKKKKGKKSKHKEEELFKPEELEAYRQQHQQQSQQQEEEQESTSAAPQAVDNDEWKKFNALTAGVDSILKKTQDDLSRIKGSSFFQRIPPASETKKKEEEEQRQIQKQIDKQEEEEREARALIAAVEACIVPVSESETEEEDEDDIFDTAYLDADIKLAYIPESPTDDQANGDDPFDTTIAEKAIGAVVDKRGKKLVPIGSAVEVLTGRVQAPSCTAIKRPTSRRVLRQPQDLLLSEEAQALAESNADTLAVAEEPKRPRSLLDDDGTVIDAPVDLTGPSLVQNLPTPNVAPVTAVTPKKQANDSSNRDILAEFDEIAKVEDEDDAEFALLAAESLTKVPAVEILPATSATTALKETWNAFGEEKEEEEETEKDPFDTSFAENILPGKAELRQIETEILEADDFEFNPRAADKISEFIKSSVHISVTDPTGYRESVSSISDRIDEHELNSLQPIHRDLLGGSNTDLSNLGDVPLAPRESDDYIEYSDPFDTSIVDQAVAPGDTELKFLEKELLGEIQIEKPEIDDLEDDDFDPRKVEQPKRPSRPDILVVGHSKTVAFDLTSIGVKQDLLGAGSEEGGKVTKPLTPYYVRENSIPEGSLTEENFNDDPFDTSFANLEPGTAELKQIEKELEQTQEDFDADDFNPRKESPPAFAQQVLENVVKEKPTVLPLKPEIPDLLGVQENVDAKVLTPRSEKPSNSELSYADPFDTSIANNILPGETELKLLENELIAEPAAGSLKRVLTDPDFNPRTSPEAAAPPVKQDLLNQPTESVLAKPLSPSVNRASFEIDEEDIDPFDTSIAANIGLGTTELKLLESELI